VDCCALYLYMFSKHSPSREAGSRLDNPNISAFYGATTARRVRTNLFETILLEELPVAHLSSNVAR
jgi:hypothetical protein